MTFVVGAKNPSEGSIWSTYGDLAADAIEIYLANAPLGSDSNNGLTSATPKLTMMGASGAKSLRVGRTGKPDRIFLRRGDTFSEATAWGSLFNGRSAEEPLIITAWGDEADPMPIVECLNANGGIYDNSGANQKLDYMAIMHIDFYAPYRDPNDSRFGTAASFKAISTGSQTNWRLLEGCHFRFCQVVQQYNFTPFVPVGTTYVRNCVFTDCWPVSTITALFFHNILTPIIENCYFDQISWYTETGDFGTATGNTAPMSHSIYIQSSCGPGVYNNIFASRTVDVQFRTGGPIRNVLLNKCTGGLIPIEPNSSSTSTTVSTTIRTGLDCEDCVILKASDSDNTIATNSWDHRGYGYYLMGADGGHIDNCIYAHTDCSTNPAFPDGMLLTAQASRLDLPCTNVTATGNIFYNFQNGTAEILLAQAASAGSSFVGSLIDQNGDNTEYSFRDPDNATLGAYLDAVTGTSGADDDDFYAAIRLQRKGNWNDALGMYCVIPYMKHRFARGTWITATPS
jgi:hypothetical protein